MEEIIRPDDAGPLHIASDAFSSSWLLEVRRGVDLPDQRCFTSPVGFQMKEGPSSNTLSLAFCGSVVLLETVFKCRIGSRFQMKEDPLLRGCWRVCKFAEKYGIRVHLFFVLR